MAKQEESYLIRDPFRKLLALKGWYTEIQVPTPSAGKYYGIDPITGKEEYLSVCSGGLPDLMAGHPEYGVKFIETKVITNGCISFTRAQKIKFPILYAYGWKIYIIAYHQSLEGTDHQVVYDRERLYQKLFQSPNVIYMFSGKQEDYKKCY